MKKLALAFTLYLSFALNALAAVNINTASQEQLEALNGIGPSKAQAIIEYRKKNGNFKTVDDLNNVPGFGDKTLAKLKPEITVAGTAPAATAAAAKPATAPAKK